MVAALLAPGVVTIIPNSEVARLCGKKPLTRLATLATLSPRERAETNQR